MNTKQPKAFRRLRYLFGRRPFRKIDRPSSPASLETMRTIVTSLVTATVTAAMIGYLSIILSVEDMTIYYRALNFSEIGKEKLIVTFAISNMGRQGALIEELGLIQVVGENLKDESCDDEQLLWNVTYYGTDKGIKFKTGNEFSYRLPGEIYVDNAKAISASVALNAGTAKKLDTTFVLPSFDASKNSVMVCPVVKLFDRSGHAILSICQGWYREPNNRSGATSTQGIGSNSFRLLPQRGSLLNTLFWRRNDLFCNSLN